MTANAMRATRANSLVIIPAPASSTLALNSCADCPNPQQGTCTGAQQRVYVDFHICYTSGARTTSPTSRSSRRISPLRLYGCRRATFRGQPRARRNQTGPRRPSWTATGFSSPSPRARNICPTPAPERSLPRGTGSGSAPTARGSPPIVGVLPRQLGAEPQARLRRLLGSAGARGEHRRRGRRCAGGPAPHPQPARTHAWWPHGTPAPGRW